METVRTNIRFQRVQRSYVKHSNCAAFTEPFPIYVYFLTTLVKLFFITTSIMLLHLCHNRMFTITPMCKYQFCMKSDFAQHKHSTQTAMKICINF